MAGSQVTLTFAGDATALQRAAQQAEQAVQGAAGAAAGATGDFSRAAAGSRDLATRLGSLGSAVDGASTVIGDLGGGVQALADIQQYSAQRASRLARAQADVEQAMLDGRQAAIDLEQATVDLAQAQTDGRQAGVDAEQAQIDSRQAMLDAKTATDEYNAAVREYGAASAEAQQAAIDMQQAQADLKQANVDAEQAQNDLRQSQTDGKQATADAAQATRDAKDAQLDLNDAQREANPTDLQTFAEQLNLVTPLLSAVVGVIGLVTAAQWAWNAAQLASPTTWIILAIVALIAVIVLIATKTTWFQDLWKAVWGGIKDAASAVGSWFSDTLWPWIKGVFDRLVDTITGIPGKLKSIGSKLFNILTWPYRTAFNFIADAWNNTIGQLRWSVPDWVPSIGGNVISAPRLPKFHTGGVASGAMGAEFLAVLRAGERVTPTAGSITSAPVRPVLEVRGERAIVELLRRLVKNYDIVPVG